MWKQIGVGVALLALGGILAVAQEKSEKKSDKQQVRFHVTGAYCMGCAEVLTESLSKAGIENASRVAVNRGRGYVIVLGDIAPGADLGELAKAINGAETPHKKQAPPSLALELHAQMDEAQAEKAKAALAEMKGVEPKRSSVNLETGALSIRLNGKEKTTVETIIADLKKAGVEAQVVTVVPNATPKGIGVTAPEKKEE